MSDQDTLPRPLTVAERAIVDRLCADDWPGAIEARQQAAVALYAGPSHGGGDNCFQLSVPDGPPLIPNVSRWPAYGLIVFEGDEATGLMDLWVTDGRLDSIEHSWFFKKPRRLPSADQLRANS